MIRFFPLIIIAVLFVLSSKATAQSSDTSGKIRFYLACENCDFDFIRKEITFVDYVRDPGQADVHCYVVRESAANGGSRYTFTFLGHKQFENVNDTLRLLQKESSTLEEFRTETDHILLLGLTRYVSHSPQAALLTIGSKASDTTSALTIDPWDSWVFSIDLNANVYAEQLHGNYNYYGNLTANRTTADWKMRFNGFGSYNENRFDDLNIRSIARSASFDALIVKSISDHWSSGPSFSVGTLTYRNRKLYVNAYAGLEYDIFPYSESTSRQLRLFYKIGAEKFSYFDTTIFNKTEELVGSHVLSASLVFQQPWGSTEFTVAGSQYLHDLSKTELNVSANLQLRLFEGLSLRVQGSYTSVHDQIFLPKTGLSNSDVLLQLQQLATSYSYNFSVGLTYTFGSIYNNVVNPRFGN